MAQIALKKLTVHTSRFKKFLLRPFAITIGFLLLSSLFQNCSRVPLPAEPAAQLGSSSSIDSNSASSSGPFSPFTLTAGQSQTQNDLTLRMQPDGNLVLVRANSAIWAASFTPSLDGQSVAGRSCAGCSARFQDDGNLVLYAATGTAFWQSGTADNPGATLSLQGTWPYIVITKGSSTLWSGPVGLYPDFTPPNIPSADPNFHPTAAKGPSTFPQNADALSQHLVFAEIHPWEATLQTDGFIARWNDFHNPAINDILSTFWPKFGIYSMGNCGYIKHVGDDLKAAGVNVAMIDWVGAYKDEQNRVERILQCISMPVAIMVDAEPDWTGSNWSDIQSRVNTVLGWYARRTDLYPNYYRDPVTQFPLVAVWDPGSVASVGDWNGFLQLLKANTPEHGIFIAGLGPQTPSPIFASSSYFDGFLAENGGEASAPQLSDMNWVLGGLTRGQFLVANALTEFNNPANCSSNSTVVTRTMAHFDSSWSNVINAANGSVKIHSAYVSYHNDGEDIGIEPAAYYAPTRGDGYASCGGALSADYLNYGSFDGLDYIRENLQWANRFRSSR